ncbi:hypothetical protein CJF32_00000374 [Rutstroemia sp. NJR-2017a WRK4]|nr:hypothetical protein CJF30_00009665 [Rutstroemia sp. NJR-2017a BBW]PQE27396.1 hypothetical protein CJF32_00000354 [Rutstroemia sp. NJR-2017a WRK4]PQE27397.1 hypothetical protein CJF32_00000374 [Rutstroemia sp. NJR-2017a WRK4]
MPGSSFWQALSFRRPSSSRSTSDSSINSSSTSSFRSKTGKRKDPFLEFEYTFDSENMSTNIQEPPKETRLSNKDTGFPEPLCHDRNTTLPHPEADTSKNATIESTDLDLHRTRSRLSMLRHHSKHKGSTLTVPSHDNVQYTDGSHEVRDFAMIQKEAGIRDDLDDPRMDPPKTVEEYVEMEDRDDQGYRAGERKKGVLRKMNLHKV